MKQLIYYRKCRIPLLCQLQLLPRAYIASLYCDPPSCAYRRRSISCSSLRDILQLCQRADISQASQQRH